VDEQFTFTPTEKEAGEALLAISRSMNKHVVRPLERLVWCLAIYGIPLALAAIFFRNSFNEIYFTFAVFIGLVLIASRLGPRVSPALAQRYAVPQEVAFSSDGVKQTTEMSQVYWPWAALTRIHALESGVVLEFQDWSWLALPDGLWAGRAGREQFVERVRSNATNLLPDLPSSTVASPFTLINVGAGLGAADVFLLEVAAFMVAAESGWQFPLALSTRTLPPIFGLMFGVALGFAVVAFYLIRRGLRSLDRRHPSTAKILANLLIWPLPLMLLIQTLTSWSR
jgi:hypothetical protein